MLSQKIQCSQLLPLNIHVNFTVDTTSTKLRALSTSRQVAINEKHVTEGIYKIYSGAVASNGKTEALTSVICFVFAVFFEGGK